LHKTQLLQKREQEETQLLQKREQEETHQLLQKREQEETHQLQKREQEEIHQQREEMHLLREEMHLLKEEMHLLKRVTGMSQNRRERPGGLETKTQQLRWGRTTRSSVITVRMPFGRLPETDTRSSRRRTRRPWKPSQRSRMRRNSPHIML